ncbi:unnamed protein product, partial [Leptidea sinapis]
PELHATRRRLRAFDSQVTTHRRPSTDTDPSSFAGHARALQVAVLELVPQPGSARGALSAHPQLHALQQTHRHIKLHGLRAVYEVQSPGGVCVTCGWSCCRARRARRCEVRCSGC